MRKQHNFLPMVIICISIAVLIFFLPNSFLNSIFSSVFGTIAAPIGTLLVSGQPNSEIAKLRDENKALFSQMAKFKNQEAQNKALLDQFQTVYPKSLDLLPSLVVGAPSFVPGLTNPEVIIIDKGEKEGVKKGQAVVVKDHLVGIVENPGAYGSRVLLATHPRVSLRVKTTAGSLGLLKGKGNGQMSIENVLLSEKLTAGDIVTTFGDLDENGNGMPPDLVVGSILSVDKKPSNVFQNAEIKNNIQFADLKTVFIIGETQ